MSAPADLRPLLERLGLTSVEGAFAFEAGQDLSKPDLGHRRRTRVVLDDAPRGPVAVYLKRYEREPLPAAIRRVWTYGLAEGPAGVEARNIQQARQAGLTGMEALVWGQDGPPWRPMRGFLVISGVRGQSLERSGAELAGRLDEPSVRQMLTVKLGGLVAGLHRLGCVHRDLYACHIFADPADPDRPPSLIDLARVFRPRWRLFRWQVKDLAQLKYSMPRAWVEACWDDFLRAYLQRRGGGDAGRYNRAVARKVAAMARRAGRRETP